MNSRLLIADSDRSLCETYERYFAAWGFDVETVSDGLQCLNRAREFHPDAMLLEWEIPWGGGDGVLSQLRDEYLTHDLHVVVTSDRRADELSPLVIDPVVACVCKPFLLASVLPLLLGEGQVAYRQS